MPVSDTNLMTMMEQLIVRCEAAESLRDKAEIGRKDAELQCDNAEYKCSIIETRLKRYKRVMCIAGISSLLLYAMIAFKKRSEE